VHAVVMLWWGGACGHGVAPSCAMCLIRVPANTRRYTISKISQWRDVRLDAATGGLSQERKALKATQQQAILTAQAGAAPMHLRPAKTKQEKLDEYAPSPLPSPLPPRTYARTTHTCQQNCAESSHARLTCAGGCHTCGVLFIFKIHVYMRKITREIHFPRTIAL